MLHPPRRSRHPPEVLISLQLSLPLRPLPSVVAPTSGGHFGVSQRFRPISSLPKGFVQANFLSFTMPVVSSSPNQFEIACNFAKVPSLPSKNIQMAWCFVRSNANHPWPKNTASGFPRAGRPAVSIGTRSWIPFETSKSKTLPDCESLFRYHRRSFCRRSPAPRSGAFHSLGSPQQNRDRLLQRPRSFRTVRRADSALFSRLRFTPWKRGKSFPRTFFPIFKLSPSRREYIAIR